MPTMWNVALGNARAAARNVPSSPSMDAERYSLGYKVRHFSLALPEGEGQDRVPNLLRNIADTLEEMEADGPVGVMDLVLHYDLESNGMRPHLTVYFYFPEEGEVS